jgi:sulfatase modifying factor 1
MSSDRHYPEEPPVHHATVSPFLMDATAVANAAFARFVAATGYVAVAERQIDVIS